MIRKGQLVGARRGTFLPKTMSLLICSDWWHCPLARGLAHPQTVFATKDYRQASRPVSGGDSAVPSMLVPLPFFFWRESYTP